MSDSSSAVPVAVSQESVFAAPSYFVDGTLGIATSLGIARVTFGSIKFNPAEGATKPNFHPVVTIITGEANLLRFAQDIVARAAERGIVTGEEEAK